MTLSLSLSQRSGSIAREFFLSVSFGLPIGVCTRVCFVVLKFVGILRNSKNGKGFNFVERDRVIRLGLVLKSQASALEEYRVSISFSWNVILYLLYV